MKFAGGDWALVRHIPEGRQWFQASYVATVVNPSFIFRSDNLAGTSSYGRYVSGPISGQPFSVPFSSLLQTAATQEILFITSDKRTFLIMTLDQLANTSATAQRVRALSSSTNPKPRLCLW